MPKNIPSRPSNPLNNTSFGMRQLHVPLLAHQNDGMISGMVSRSEKRSAYARRPTRPTSGDPNGSFEERCAWMRARQASKALHALKVKTGANTGRGIESKVAHS
jgi:hypothetical protein